MADTVISVVVGTQIVDCGDADLYTFINDGSGSVFYRKRNDAVTLVGTGAEITALGAGELKIGERITVDGIAYDMVCGSDTGTTATVRKLRGSIAASMDATITGVTVNMDIDKLNGNTINVSSGNTDTGTQVVNQATNGVNGVAFGTAAQTAAVDGSFHQKLEYIGAQLENNTAPFKVAATGGYVRQDTSYSIARESGGNLATAVALLGKLYPVASVANANSAAGSGSWVDITLAANTISVDVRLAGACHLAAPTTTPSGAIGAIYQPNITYRIPTPTGHLWAYGIGAAHVVNTTSFTRA